MQRVPQAEIEYGRTPAFIDLIALILCVGAGYLTSMIVPASLSFLGWVTGIGVWIVSAVLLRKRFRDRAVFNRVYKTKNN